MFDALKKVTSKNENDIKVLNKANKDNSKLIQRVQALTQDEQDQLDTKFKRQQAEVRSVSENWKELKNNYITLKREFYDYKMTDQAFTKDARDKLVNLEASEYTRKNSDQATFKASEAELNQLKGTILKLRQ